MDESDRRERRKSRTRDEILRVAVELFERDGYDATTIDDIADAADISSRTFFRYFESKLELVLGVKDDKSEFEERLAERPLTESPLDAIRHVFREDVVEMLTSDDLASRQIRVALNSPSLRPVLLEHFHEHQSNLTQALAKRLGDSEDDLRPRVMASAASGAIWTALNRWMEAGGEIDQLAEVVDEAFEVLKSGLA